MRIDPDAYRFIVFLGSLAVIDTVLLHQPTWGLVLGLLVLAVMAFFRDPKRQLPLATPVILSPAEGKVLEIVPNEVFPMAPAGINFTRISIFLSVFNVHINRAPVTGQLKQLTYHPGKFMMAFHPKASLDNEQSHLLFSTPEGTLVGVKQIAGWVARRVVTRIRPGDAVQAGQSIGLIRFGSRVDVFIPANAKICVKPGDKVTDTESILAHLT